MASPPQHTPTTEPDTMLGLSKETVSTSLTLLPAVQQELAEHKDDSHDQNFTPPAEQELVGKIDSCSSPIAAQQLFYEQENSTSHMLLPVEQALNKLKEYMDHNFTPSVDQKMSDEIKNANFDFYWTCKGRHIVRSENYIQLACEKAHHLKNWRIAKLEKVKAYQELYHVQAGHKEKATNLKHHYLDQVRKQVIKDLEARLIPIPTDSDGACAAKKRQTKK
ncbi:hypothetical protein DV736_g3999, partial [Chaetothyriales sp. CBS 134916]